MSPYRREPVVPPEAWRFMAIGVALGMVVLIVVVVTLRLMAR